MDDSNLNASTIRQMNEVGPLLDRLHLGADNLPAMHQRNIDHLMSYVRARRIHLTSDTCEAGEPCCGGVAAYTMADRDLNSDGGYFAMLVLSAISIIDDKTAQLETHGAQTMRMDLDLREAEAARVAAEQRCAELEIEVTELHTRVTTCETLIGDMQASWPTDSDPSSRKDG